MIYTKEDVNRELTKQNINAFLNCEFADGFNDKKENPEKDFGQGLIGLSDAYRAKRFTVENINAKRAIRDMYYSKDDIYELWDDTDLLYIDVPKYMREQERFKFDTKWYSALFSALSRYEGDWILTWKNYVEISNLRRPKSMYSSLRTKGKVHSISSEYFIDDIPKKVTKNNMRKLYEKIKLVGEMRPLYVYSYRDDNRNHPNSIVFITTIDFVDISDSDFQSKYKIDFLYNGRLKKMTYDEFYTNVTKFLDKDKKQNTDSNKKGAAAPVAYSATFATAPFTYLHHNWLTFE